MLKVCFYYYYFYFIRQIKLAGTDYNHSEIRKSSYLPNEISAYLQQERIQFGKITLEKGSIFSGLFQLADEEQETCYVLLRVREFTVDRFSNVIHQGQPEGANRVLDLVCKRGSEQ